MTTPRQPVVVSNRRTMNWTIADFIAEARRVITAERPVAQLDSMPDEEADR